MNLVDLGKNLRPVSYVEFETVVRTGATGGVVFDYYAEDDFKFLVIDVATDQLLIGHVDPKRGWTIDKAVSSTYGTDKDYTVNLVLVGTSVSVRVDGSTVGSCAYNAALADGRLGLLTQGGTGSFDDLRIATNDPAFTVVGELLAEPTLSQVGTVTLALSADTIWTNPATDDPGVTQPVTSTVTVDSGVLDTAITHKQTTVSSLEITEGGLVRDINIRLSITHARFEDLSVFLTGPDGTRVELFSGIAGTDLGSWSFLLDDEAGTPIEGGLNTFESIYRPQGNLALYEATVLAGTWTLEVVDTVYGVDGLLNSWSLVAGT